MRRSAIPLNMLATMQSAHVIEPEFLNSQKIEARYGSYDVQMLASDGLTRQSALSSQTNSQTICRTFAFTRFTESADALGLESQQRIRAGASIGATLKQDGWTLLKATIYVGSIVLDHVQHPVLELMHLETPQSLALHIYKLSIERDGSSLDYATISELHHPDYLSESDIRSLFPVDEASTATRPEIADFIASIREA